LQALRERLGVDKFVQTHRSFVVNLEKVNAVDLEDMVVQLGAHQVSLSKRNREEFLLQLERI